jgi:release factor glutamine methyltransferase
LPDLGAIAGAVSLADALDRAGRHLLARGVSEPRRDASVLLGHATGLSREKMVARPDRAIDESQRHSFAALIGRRAAREPVARILGRRGFWKSVLRVTPDTLDPRPDSETLIEALLSEAGEANGGRHVLDLGTGSGCLLLALLGEWACARGVGVDLSAAAVAVARVNALELGLAARCRFVVGDWGRPLKERFDVVVANPPYLSEAEIGRCEAEVARYEPRLALYGGADGLDAYRAVVPQLGPLLTPGGLVAIEIGRGQARAVTAMVEAGGLLIVGVRADLSGIDRCVLARRR